MNIVVFACHPDDETLGCGGTLMRHKRAGHRINWVIATRMTEDAGFSRKDIARRDREIRSVSRAYGFDGVYELGIPAAKVDRCGENVLVEKISAVFNKVRPEVVYLPFKSDVHGDHRTLFEAAYSCTKTFRYPFIRKIMMMEAVSETEFAPALKEDAFLANYYVDISDFLTKKIRIAGLYKGQIGAHPFPRSAKNIKALATFRGATAGMKYAEAFMILKERW